MKQLFGTIGLLALMVASASLLSAQPTSSLLSIDNSTTSGESSDALPLPHDAILLPSPRYPTIIVPYAGPDYSIHRGNFRLEQDGILCCEFSEGTGLGFTAGLRMFLPLGKRWYLSPRLGYTRHVGEFSASSELFPFRGLDDSVELMRFDEELSAPLPTVAADLIWLYQIDSALGLYLTAGPSFE